MTHVTESEITRPGDDEAVIYLRMSQDRTGQEAGVTRQREDCEQRCRDRGWRVVAVESDNDMSASRSRRRPGFEALLEHLYAERARVVVCWHLDRLQRSRADELRLYELCQVKDIVVSLVRGPDLDWRSPTGRYVADNLSALARMEVEMKADRQRRASDQRAQQGRPYGGRRPFGYQPGGMLLLDSEAELLRDAARRIILGGSVGRIAREWNARGVETVTGRPWVTTTVREVLLRPRNVGRRIHRGVDIGPAQWEPILDVGTYSAVRAILTNPERAEHLQGAPARYLLSGVAVCGVEGCGLPLWGTRRESGMPVYRCRSRRHITIRADRVEERVVDVMVARMERPDAAAMFAAPDRRDDLIEWQDQEKILKVRKTEAADLFARRVIDAEQLAAATGRLNEDLGRVQARIAAALLGSMFTDLAEAPDIAAEVRGWAVNDLPQFRALASWMTRIRVFPPGRGRGFRDDLVAFDWRDHWS